MKTELRVHPHAIADGAHVIEVWYDNEFLATVTGCDGPGVRVISKHHLMPMYRLEPGPQVVEIRVTTEDAAQGREAPIRRG